MQINIKDLKPTQEFDTLYHGQCFRYQSQLFVKVNNRDYSAFCITDNTLYIFEPYEKVTAVNIVLQEV